MIGGMRGAVAVALVTSLPAGALKDKLEAVTFGVVLAYKYKIDFFLSFLPFYCKAPIY